MPDLVLGPLLRHVGTHDATIWVETDGACTVTVCRGSISASQPTFQVGRHSYAIVVLDGLEPGSSVPYQVLLDGRRAWPPADGRYPASLIRTVDPDRGLRLLFGSCRAPSSVVVRDPTGTGHDALDAYARRMAREDPAAWPDALLMLGDQVYADETSPVARRRLGHRRDPRRPPHMEVANFEEYTQLYRETWGDPDIRWLLSTVPTSMIFDDHDVRDDWNTSAAWRREIEATGWWSERIAGALMSYWLYQHLGNLSPRGLREDRVYREVLAQPDAEALLHRFALDADREPGGDSRAMWSYRRDFGRVRVLIVDSRAGRVLAEGHRAMLSDAEFDWIERQVEDGEFDHLVIGTSVPWLLPRALHDLESADEAIAGGSRGPVLAWLAERLRRVIDLEHWAAFRGSFDRLSRLIVRVGTGAHGAPPPATICVLSGDVHHTYLSEARFREPMVSRVFQITCSPFHNTIPLESRPVFKVAWTRSAHRLSAWLASFARVPPVPFMWQTAAGPYFGNRVGQLTLVGRSARFTLARPVEDGSDVRAELVPEATRELGPMPEPAGAISTGPVRGGLAA